MHFRRRHKAPTFRFNQYSQISSNKIAREMTHFFQIEPGVYVSGQIEPSDLPEIDRLGIRTIVDNRPDEEVGEGLSSDLVGQAAARHGISFLYKPVWGFELGDPDIVQSIRQSVSALPRPVLFYCRSGRRSTLLWAQDAIERLDPETIRARANMAGIEPGDLQMILNEYSDQLVA
jgi:sulfide:quinone oxidoreductase